MEDLAHLKGKDLEEELRSIRKSFEVLLLAIEAEGVGPATEVASRIMNRLDEAIKQIRGEYVHLVLDRRFRPFVDDHRRFLELKASPGPKSSEAFIELVSRIERHIETVDREMRVLIPQEPRIVGWSRRHWRRLAAGALGLVVIAGGWVGVRHLMTRGKGLSGEYFTGTNFRKAVAKRRDLTINFSFRDKSPIRGLTGENFSVRWKGSLVVDDAGSYEFVTRTDDGVRLWINDELLIDNWTVHRQMTDKATRELEAGKHKLRLEWFQRRGPALMQLYWRGPGDAQPRLIEPQYLQPE